MSGREENQQSSYEYNVVEAQKMEMFGDIPKIVGHFLPKGNSVSIPVLFHLLLYDWVFSIILKVDF